MARICADCRQPIPPGERPDDHFCLDDREPDSPDEGSDGEEAA